MSELFRLTGKRHKAPAPVGSELLRRPPYTGRPDAHILAAVRLFTCQRTSIPRLTPKDLCVRSNCSSPPACAPGQGRRNLIADSVRVNRDNSFAPSSLAHDAYRDRLSVGLGRNHTR